MSRYTYTRGNWADGCSLPDWRDDEDFEAYLRRIGHASAKLTVGSEHGSSIEVYESSESSSFFALVCPMGGACYEVFLPDFPSFMLFLKEYGPAFSSVSIEGNQKETLALLEKFFRVSHGHAAHEICKQCDPQGWEEALQRRAARAGGNGGV